jgi:hypothetical protein
MFLASFDTTVSTALAYTASERQMEGCVNVVAVACFKALWHYSKQSYKNHEKLAFISLVSWLKLSIKCPIYQTGVPTFDRR